MVVDAAWSLGKIAQRNTPSSDPAEFDSVRIAPRREGLAAKGVALD